MKPRTMGIAVTAGLLTVVAVAQAIPRADIISRAPEFEEHSWTCTSENLTADCADGSWQPARSAGPQVGIPYCWGDWASVQEFDQQIADGWGAGSLPAGLFLDCTTGVDCSGYVSQLWQHPHKLGTATIPEVSFEVQSTELQPGDVFNDANHHVIMFLGIDGNGDAIVTESTNASACLGVCRRSRPWSVFSGYIPRAYFYADLPTHTGAGTTDDPILIDAFPFVDSRNTDDAQSDVFDYYSAAPDTNESGPEFIYVFHVATGGTLTVKVGDAAGVDIDIHLLASSSADDCLVRDDKEFSHEITSPGTYYLVADTYVGSSGTEYTGAYLLEADFTGTLEAPQPDAGAEPALLEPVPEPVPEAGPDAVVIAVDAGSEAGATPPSSGGTYTAEEAEGCACRLDGRNRSGPPLAAVALAVLIGLWRRRR
ncbi:MAG: MYXO-CTERM sorting domain-containing protein [Myxococcota bacterium]